MNCNALLCDMLYASSSDEEANDGDDENMSDILSSHDEAEPEITDGRRDSNASTIQVEISVAHIKAPPPKPCTVYKGPAHSSAIREYLEKRSETKYLYDGCNMYKLKPRKEYARHLQRGKMYWLRRRDEAQ